MFRMTHLMLLGLMLSGLMLLGVMVLAGCSGHLLPRPLEPVRIETDRFVMVTAGPQDTFASLARRHLDSQEKAWQIAAFHHADTLAPGQTVIIPRMPLIYGGIESKGYQTVPVLLYSQLARQPTQSKATRINDFDLQLQFLADHGYVTASLEQFRAFLSLTDSLPPKTVIISLDSTRAWVYDIAYPRIRGRGMRAVVFIRWKEVGAKGRLTWPQLAEMAAHGFDIGLLGETISPPAGKDLKQYFDAFEKKFTEPQKAFKTHLNMACQYFAFAAGVSDDLTIAMLKKHGYRMAFTRKRGSSAFFSDTFKIKRSLISGQFDPARFRQNLITFRAAELK